MPVLNPFTNDKSFIGFKNWTLGGTSVGGFNPRVLFRNNEPGVWYDPSDVANLSWRRNLLTYTEQFNNAIWQKVGATLAVNTGIAPDGTTTADQLIESATADRHVIYWTNLSVTNGIAYTWSVYLKSYGARYAVIGFDTVSNPRVFVDLLDGIVTVQVNGATGSITAAGNGWYRVSCTAVTTGASMYPQIGISDRATYGEPLSFAMPYYTGDGTSGLYIWGAQLELGSTATEYQRITDVHTEVRERFPKATLFQDTTGTQPVTTAGQSVALMLDKSRGLTLGPELVTNGGFDTDTAWTKGAGCSISGGSAVFTAVNSGAGFAQTAISADVWYVVTYTIQSIDSGSVRVALGTTLSAVRTAPGTYTETLLSNGTQILLRSGTTTTTATVDNISVRELPGNHATQSITASRPIYAVEPVTGRRNLLTYTEQFDNAVWIKSNATITPNAAAAPDGTTTADLILDNGAGGTGAVGITSNFTITNAPHTFSVYIKASGLAWAAISTSGFVGATQTGTSYFDLTTGTLGAFNQLAASIQAVGNGWYRCSGTVIPDAGDLTGTFAVYAADANNDLVVDRDGTSSVFVWGAQLETGSTATAYQRVVSKYDVTEAGVPSRSYLSFDGIDDFMVTPTITPGIDKVQVFAGVRKLSDAARGIVAEFSASAGNVGTFGLEAPRALTQYMFASGGSIAFRESLSDNIYPAPHSAIITGVGDISADISRVRVNATEGSLMVNDQGTGNYLAYPLYIGRRGGATLPFNGNIYGLLVRFGANLSNSQVIAAERWLNNKTGAF